MRKVVLAYTGSVGTRLAIHFLRMKRGLRVITFSANVGQDECLEPIGERALSAGAEAAHIRECRETFLHDFCFKALQGSALYQEGYPLFTALTRPLIVREMVRIAREEQADYIAHGCTGQGNDHVRFQAAAAALAPDLQVLTPLQEYGCLTPEDEIRYAGKFQIAIDEEEEGRPYRIERNLWGGSVAHENAGDPWKTIPAGAYCLTADPTTAPDEALEVSIGFEEGVPVQINGEKMEAVQLVETLNEIGGRHGAGRVDMIEDNIGGIKSREIYEIPGPTLLYRAHRALESLVLGQELVQYKAGLAKKFSELVYYGLWFSELREALQAFMDSSQRFVTGEVRLLLYKGSVRVLGRRSPHSLYDPGLAKKGWEGSFGAELARRAFLDLHSTALKASTRLDDYPD